jgi:hypothetical protein
MARAMRKPPRPRLTGGPAAKILASAGFARGPHMNLLRPALFACLAPLLAACNASNGPVATAAAPAAPASTRFPDVAMPAGSGCAAVIGRFEAVTKADYETGNVNAKVYEQMQKELAPARTACAAGQDAQARGIVAATKSRHGYPA